MRQSLKTRFFLITIAVFAILAVLGQLSFQGIANRFVRLLGERFAEKQVLYDKARIQAPLLREIALSQKSADSPILKRWAQNENDPGLRDAALKELESFRRFFQDRSYFFIVDHSLNYYYNDRQQQYTGRELRYALDPAKTPDSWYFRLRESPHDYELNVDYDVELKVTKVWINTLVREQGRMLGLSGTGLDLTAFLKDIVQAQQAGVTNILVDDEGAIQAHPDPRLIDLNTKSKQAGERSTIFRHIPSAEEQAALRAALARLKSGKSAALTLALTLDGKPQLVGIAYVPELRWFNLSTMDLDAIVGHAHFLPLAALLLASLLLSLVLMAWLLNSLVLKRLGRLSLATERLAQGQYELDLPAERDDELGALAERFTQMAATVRDHTQNLEHKVAERTQALAAANTELAQANRQILDSIRYAKLIQTAILPRPEHLQALVGEHMALWLPRDVVGGDFYFLHAEKSATFLGVVDCTGHGVPGAFMSMTAHAVLHQLLTEAAELPLPELLAIYEDRLRHTLSHEPGADALDYGLDIGLCRLNHEARTLDYCGFDIDLYVVDGSGVDRLRANRGGLGYRRRRRRETSAHGLSWGEGLRFYLSSDGLLDQAGGAEGYGFGRARFEHFLSETAGLSLHEQERRLAARLADYQGQHAQRDDITVLGFSPH
ncbi:MAG: SpoIIE family protein phosphatase [Gammaproteobacteria bacterium]|nr:SpoIIE family protein phosphatase [Gammaproteobacteria bacterium]